MDAVQTQMQELGTEVMLESMELVQLAADEDSANRRVSIDDSSKSPAVGSAMDYGGGLDLGLNDETRGYDGPDLRNLREILDFDNPSTQLRYETPYGRQAARSLRRVEKLEFIVSSLPEIFVRMDVGANLEALRELAAGEIRDGGAGPEVRQVVSEVHRVAGKQLLELECAMVLRVMAELRRFREAGLLGLGEKHGAREEGRAPRSSVAEEPMLAEALFAQKLAWLQTDTQNLNVAVEGTLTQLAELRTAERSMPLMEWYGSENNDVAREFAVQLLACKNLVDGVGRELENQVLIELGAAVYVSPKGSKDGRDAERDSQNSSRAAARILERVKGLFRGVGAQVAVSKEQLDRLAQMRELAEISCGLSPTTSDEGGPAPTRLERLVSQQMREIELEVLVDCKRSCVLGWERAAVELGATPVGGPRVSMTEWELQMGAPPAPEEEGEECCSGLLKRLGFSVRDGRDKESLGGGGSSASSSLDLSTGARPTTIDVSAKRTLTKLENLLV